MVGLVSTDIELLEEINARIHNALTEAPVKYVAERYSELLKHLNEDIFAIVLVQSPPSWNSVIMDELTETEKLMIQDISNDWFIS